MSKPLKGRLKAAEPTGFAGLDAEEILERAARTQHNQHDIERTPKAPRDTVQHVKPNANSGQAKWALKASTTRPSLTGRSSRRQQAPLVGALRASHSGAAYLGR